MKLTRFTFEPEPRELFLDVPLAVSGSSPDFVAPFRSEERRLLSPENRFYTYGTAMHIVATEEGRPVGRCSAFDNPHLGSDEGRIGLIGNYQVIDHWEVAEALLSEATSWLKERQVREIWGPMQFSIWHSYRFLVRGFETEPFFGEPRNPPHHPEQWARFGFEPFARWFSWDLMEPHLVAMRDAALQLREKFPPPEGYRSTPLSMDRFDEELRSIYQLVTQGFQENLGFTPIEWEEFEPLYGGMQHYVAPELVPLVRGPSGDVVAMGYVYPDPIDAIRAMKGDSGLFAKLRFAWKKRSTDRAVFHTVVIRPDLRKQGLVEGELGQLIDQVLSHGLRRAVGALAKEGPTIYQKTGPSTREYALFRREV